MSNIYLTPSFLPAHMAALAAMRVLARSLIIIPVPANYFPVLRKKFPDLFRAGNSSQRADVAREIVAPTGPNEPKCLQNANLQGKIPCSEGIHARKPSGRKIHQEWSHHSARSI